MGNITFFMIFAVLDVSLAVNVCINCSFFTFIRSIIEQAQNDQIEETPNVVSNEEPNEPIKVPVTVDATERNLPVDLDVDQSNPEYDDSRNVQIIAGVPPTNYRSPRPRRNAGRLRRYLD